MNSFKWVIFAVISVGVLATLVLISQSSRIDVSGIDTGEVLGASELSGEIGDNTFNQSTSKVTLIEYGDFQCPGCAGAHPRVQALMEEYGDSIQFVFRNFPLTQNHPNAKAAASAAESAGLQGKYWEMHDTLFTKQSEWAASTPSERTDLFVSYAALMGLDIEKFREDLASDAVAQKIKFDIALGAKDKIQSTPSFTLNGTFIEQSIWSDDEAWRNLINEEIAKNLPSSTGDETDTEDAKEE